MIQNYGGYFGNDITAPAQSKVPAPTTSAPVASNIGKAKLPVTDSQSFSVGADGVHTDIPPIKISPKELGESKPVVTAAPGAVPDKSPKVIATFVTTTAENVKVGDGDTVYVNKGVAKTGEDLPNFTCRLDGIDTPEKARPSKGKQGQPMAEEATAYLKNLIQTGQMNISVAGVDKDGRQICQLEMEGKDLNLEMVKAGMAWVYRQYVRKDVKDSYMAAENEARQAGLGIFGLPVQDREYPADFRARTDYSGRKAAKSNSIYLGR